LSEKKEKTLKKIKGMEGGLNMGREISMDGFVGYVTKGHRGTLC
jgi:hypothetical protein